MKGFVLIIVLIASCVSPKGPQSVDYFSGKGDGVADDTKAFQKAIFEAAAQKDTLFMPAGKYFISGTIEMPTNSVVFGVGENVEIIFKAISMPLFRAIGQNHIVLSGMKLKGTGQYNRKWKGSFNRNMERCVYLENCKDVVVQNCSMTNFGKSGITVLGSSNVSILNNRIEGTHREGNALKVGDNYQFGIFLGVKTDCKVLRNINILNNDIGFTTQGIITSQGNNGVSSKEILLKNNYIHDVIGQHGIYCSTSNTSIINNKIERMGLEGIKIQAAHESLEKFEIVDNEILECLNSQAINITEIHEGVNSISDVKIRNNRIKFCARGVNLYGRLIDLEIDSLHIEKINKEYGIYIRGYEMDNVRLKNITISNPMKESIYVDNDDGSKNISFSNISILSKQDGGVPVKVRKGSNIEFRNIKFNKEKRENIFSISPKSTSISIKKEK